MFHYICRMKIRIIKFEDYESYFSEKGVDIYDNDGEDLGFESITDEEFMEIYKRHEPWEFDSLEAFAGAFNSDANTAPVPSCHLIRFFYNE